MKSEEQPMVGATRSTEPVPRAHDAHGLRIGFSGLFLRTPENGTGRYARRVLEQLQAAPDVAPIVFTDGPLPDLQYGHSPLVLVPSGPGRLPAAARKVVWEQVGLALGTVRCGVDVLYSPHFSLPLVRTVPSVISIHDLIPLTEPAYRNSRAWGWYFALVGTAARRAQAVLTLSEHAAREIRRLLAIPASRIRVVNPGIEPAFRPAAGEAIARAGTRYALPERYLLYLGGSVAHKNIGHLFRALAFLKQHRARLFDLVPPLVVVAPHPQPAASVRYPDWRGMAVALGVAPHVHFVERVAEADLAAVYSGALAFVFPSRSEGFGMTPLEAMACGVPVLSSNAGSLPEAVGDAAVLATPDDIAAWADGIATLCTDADLRSRLRRDGQVRARMFTWERTGAQVLETVRGVAR